MCVCVEPTTGSRSLSLGTSNQVISSAPGVPGEHGVSRSWTIMLGSVLEGPIQYTWIRYIFKLHLRNNKGSARIFAKTGAMPKLLKGVPIYKADLRLQIQIYFILNLRAGSSTKTTHFGLGIPWTNYFLFIFSNSSPEHLAKWVADWTLRTGCIRASRTTREMSAPE